MTEPIIKLDQVKKNYGARRGVDGVTFAVNRGEVFGYLGPNGAGKTTTIRLILDLIRPDHGAIHVFGQNANHASHTLHGRIGFLPGELAVYDAMTGEQFLRFIGRIHGNYHAPFVADLAARLTCPLQAPLRALSQGNKRKIGLIMAFMQKPQLIILDEPTNGLDPLVRHEFYQIVNEAHAAGQTVFLSSHNLPEVQRLCTRVGIIRSGKLVAVEEIANLNAKQLKTADILTTQPLPADIFSALPEVEILSRQNNTLRCRIQGSMDRFLKIAAQYPVETLLCDQPSLEEIFLTYYGAEETDE